MCCQHSHLSRRMPIDDLASQYTTPADGSASGLGPEPSGYVSGDSGNTRCRGRRSGPCSSSCSESPGCWATCSTAPGRCGRSVRRAASPHPTIGGRASPAATTFPSRPSKGPRSSPDNSLFQGNLCGGTLIRGTHARPKRARNPSCFGQSPLWRSPGNGVGQLRDVKSGPRLTGVCRMA